MNDCYAEQYVMELFVTTASREVESCLVGGRSYYRVANRAESPTSERLTQNQQKQKKNKLNALSPPTLRIIDNINYRSCSDSLDDPDDDCFSPVAAVAEHCCHPNADHHSMVADVVTNALDSVAATAAMARSNDASDVVVADVGGCRCRNHCARPANAAAAADVAAAAAAADTAAGGFAFAANDASCAAHRPTEPSDSRSRRAIRRRRRRHRRCWIEGPANHWASWACDWDGCQQ